MAIFSALGLAASFQVLSSGSDQHLEPLAHLGMAVGDSYRYCRWGLCASWGVVRDVALSDLGKLAPWYCRRVLLAGCAHRALAVRA